MSQAPDIHADFAGWTAHNWARLAPDADSTAAAVAIRFIRAADDLARSHAATIKPWKNQGISTIGDFRILGLLRHLDGDGMSTQRIAEHLGFDPATVSSRLKRLEKHGHIERIDNPNNRRTHSVKLCPASMDTVDAIYRALVANHESFFDKLNTGEHQTLADYLERL